MDEVELLVSETVCPKSVRRHAHGSYPVGEHVSSRHWLDSRAAIFVVSMELPQARRSRVAVYEDAGLTPDGCSAASLPKYSGLAALRTLVDSRRVLSVNCDGDVE